MDRGHVVPEADYGADDMSVAIVRDEDRLVWSLRSVSRDLQGHVLLACPSVVLSQETALLLANGANYTTAFAGAKAVFRGNMHEFQVIYGMYDLFRTSEPSIKELVLVLMHGDAPLPPLGNLLKLAASLLRQRS